MASKKEIKELAEKIYDEGDNYIIQDFNEIAYDFYKEDVESLIYECDKKDIDFEPPKWSSNRQGWYFERNQNESPFKCTLDVEDLEFSVELTDSLHDDSPFIWMNEQFYDYFSWKPTKEDIEYFLKENELELIDLYSIEPKKVDSKDIAKYLTETSDFIDDIWERFQTAIYQCNTYYPTVEDIEDYLSDLDTSELEDLLYEYGVKEPTDVSKDDLLGTVYGDRYSERKRELRENKSELFYSPKFKGISYEIEITDEDKNAFYGYVYLYRDGEFIEKKEKIFIRENSTDRLFYYSDKAFEVNKNYSKITQVKGKSFYDKYTLTGIN